LDKYLEKLFTKQDKEPSSGDDSTLPDVRFLESHLAHLLARVDLVIILRCHPDELRHRLETKDWPENKIMENLEAEAVDAITIECINKYEKDNLFEIDTTHLEPKKVMETILGISNGTNIGNKPGKIDWSEEIMKWY
jgi:adenylate kinase